MPEIPQQLVDALRRTENRLVPFVGAGLSVSVNSSLFPSWDGLLAKLGQQLDTGGVASRQAAEKFAALLAQQEPLEAAQVAEEKLTPARFNLLMGEIFGVGMPPKADLSGPGAVWRLGSKLVITTNYDSVLDWPRTLQGDEVVRVHNLDEAGLTKIAAGTTMKKPTVWHLHGSARAGSYVLSQRSYLDLYGPEPGRPFRLACETLRTVLTTRPLLFVGFSLDDPFIVRQMKEILKLTAGTTEVSWLLLKRPQDPGAGGVDVDALLAGQHVEVVYYEDYGTPFFQFLHRLGREAGVAEEPHFAGGKPGLSAEKQGWVDELSRLTDDLFLDPAVIAEANNRLIPPPTFRLGGAADAYLLLREATCRLAASNRTSAGHAPLLSLVRTLLPRCPADLRPALEDWMARAAAAFGQRGAATGMAAEPALQDGYALALIRQTHGAKPFSAEAWYYRDQGFERLVDERACTVAELHRFLGEVVREITSVGLAKEAVDLAFVLPASLLAEAIDRWRPKAADGSDLPPIGSTHRVVLRPERLRDPGERDAWKAAWERWKAAAKEKLPLTELPDRRPASRRAAWLGAAALNEPDCRGHLCCDDLAMVVLRSPPRSSSLTSTPDPLEVALQQGVPVALWPRPPLSEDPMTMMQAVFALLGQTEVGRLTVALRDLRDRDKDDPNGAGGCFGLLIDDADRPPPTRQAANRLSLAVEFG